MNDHENWERGARPRERSMLVRRGWVKVYQLGRIQYWRDPVSGQTLDDNNASRVMHLRETASSRSTDRRESR
jgi:hypothetical protein